jgi:hypothetical protein
MKRIKSSFLVPHLKEAPFDVVIAEERRANHAAIVAIKPCSRYGDVGFRQSLHDTVLPIHSMRTFQQLPRRLLTYHKLSTTALAIGRTVSLDLENVRRIALPMRKLHELSCCVLVGDWDWDNFLRREILH